MTRSRLAAGLDLHVRHRLLAGLCCCLALLGIAGTAVAQAGPAPNQVILFEGTGYTGRPLTVSLQPGDIQQVATLAAQFPFQSILVGDDVAAYVYQWVPADTPILPSYQQAPITQSQPSFVPGDVNGHGRASVVVVAPRSAVGPLPADNPMRVTFVAHTQAPAQAGGLESMTYLFQGSQSGRLCHNVDQWLLDLGPDVIEIWTGNRPQSEFSLYFYPQANCQGQQVGYQGVAGGLPHPVPGMNGPVRSFSVAYSGPAYAERSPQPGIGQPVPPSGQGSDLSGRWLASTGETLDFTAAPGGQEWVATGAGYRAIMLFLPSGRVRLDLIVDGQMASTEGDFYPNGAPAYQPNRNAAVIFDPLPGTSDFFSIGRL